MDEPVECSAKRSHLVQWNISRVIHLWEGTFIVESGWGRGKSGCFQSRGEGGGHIPHQQDEDIPGIYLALLLAPAMPPKSVIKCPCCN